MLILRKPVRMLLAAAVEARPLAVDVAALPRLRPVGGGEVAPGRVPVAAGVVARPTIGVIVVVILGVLGLGLIVLLLVDDARRGPGVGGPAAGEQAAIAAVSARLILILDRSRHIDRDRLRDVNRLRRGIAARRATGLRL